MSNLPLVYLWKAYRPSEKAKASLMGFLFFVLYGGIIVTPIITISMIYVPFMEYFLLAIYIALSLCANYGISIAMETLQQYRLDYRVAYDTIKRRLTVVIAAIIFVILSIVFVVYLK